MYFSVIFLMALEMTIKTEDEKIIFFEHIYMCLINLHRLNNKSIIILHFQRIFLFRKLYSSFFFFSIKHAV